MTKSISNVPSGMSYPNAFHALWKNARPSKSFEDSRQQKSTEATVSTAEKIVEVFLANIEYAAKNFDSSENPFFITNEGGRDMQVDFKHFPQLDVSEYDRIYGNGTANILLYAYSLIPSQHRFDPKDSYHFRHLQQPLHESASTSPRYRKTSLNTIAEERLSGCCIVL